MHIVQVKDQNNRVHHAPAEALFVRRGLADKSLEIVGESGAPQRGQLAESGEDGDGGGVPGDTPGGEDAGDHDTGPGDTGPGDGQSSSRYPFG